MAAIVLIGLLDREQGFPPSVMWASLVVGVVGNVQQRGGFQDFGPIDALPGFYHVFVRLEGDDNFVRYAWADNPECNLFNADGLPAVPFRTDDWPQVKPQP